MIDFELNEFGRRLGMPGLELNENAAAGVTIEGLGVLTFERVETPEGQAELLVSLSRPIESTEAGRFGALLERLDWRRHPVFTFSAGLFRDRLILSTRLNESAVTARMLENVLRALSDELGQV